MVCLIADIGGTNSRCAVSGPDGRPTAIRVFTNRDYASLTELLRAYLSGLDAQTRPSHAVLAVAAPVRGDEVRMINIDWAYSRSELCRDLELDELEILNDFEALAHALPTLADADLRRIGGGDAAPDKPKVVIGPGTGLGVATLIPTEAGWHSVSGEGGHVTLAACNDEEVRVIAAARAEFGHCSAERLISGPGLGYLHRLLHGTQHDLTPKRIAELADQGDAAAKRTFDMFFEMFGTVAGNVALTVGAFGGVFIGGGILPRNVERFAASGFRRRFEAKGRYDDYLRAMPTYLIVAEHPTLNGLALRASRRSGFD